LVPYGATRYFWYFYGFNYKKGLLGIIPGLLQAVKNKNRYIKQIFTKNKMGRAGEIFQFYPRTNTQYGMTIPNEQQWIYSIPGKSERGPVTQPLQKNLDLVGHI